MTVRLPVVRHGRPYESMEQVEVCDARTGETLATIDQANPGLVARDLRRWPHVETPPTAQMQTILRRAAERLLDASDSEYTATVERTAGTTGLTEKQVQAQVNRLAKALVRLADVAQTRSPPCPPMAFVLPSNAPGVHASWLTAIALGFPVALKPGSREPWFPAWLSRVLWDAGLPEAMIGLYAGDHTTAQTMVETAAATVLFGDDATVDRYRDAPSVDVRGPGRSKALVSRRAASDASLIAPLVTAVSEFAGRSCLNTSSIGIVGGTPEDAARLANALQDALSSQTVDSLGAWPERQNAEGIRSWLASIGHGPATPSLHQRSDGLWALSPLAFAVADTSEALASMEAPFPWVAVAPVEIEDLARWTDGALAVSIHAEGHEDRELRDALAGVDRVVDPGQFTTDATDVEHHIRALRQLEP